MGIMCRRACGFLGGSGGSTNKKVSKLKNLLHLTVCRLAILKKQRKARCNHARGDLLQLVRLGHRDRALLRAELVIKEENMLDVFAMLEGYCHLLTERSVLLRGEKVCPDELREAVSSLIYASSRLADLPELYHVRNVFSYMFGKDFTNSAVEIRNCCRVNPKIVQKLSTRQPSLETRMRITKEIAASNGITFDLVCNDSITCPDIAQTADTQVNRTDSSARAAHKYKDAVSAAQAAFESAEDAAAAARAAVELSRSSHSSPDDHRSDAGRRKEEPNVLENDSTLDSDEEDAAEYFSEAHLNPEKKNEPTDALESDEDDAIELHLSNERLYHRDEPEEEDTFELATLNISDSPSPLYQKIITGRRNRELNSGSEDMGLFRLSYSSDTTSCQSKSGCDDAANVLPTAMRRAVSVRTRRGLPR